MKIHGSATSVRITYRNGQPLMMEMLFGTCGGGRVWYRSNAVPLRTTARWLTANCVIHGVPVTEIYL